MGTILRLVMLAVLFWLLYTLVRRALAGPPPEPPALPMRQCAQCGVNIPETESTRSGGQFFCCEAHRDLYLRSRP